MDKHIIRLVPENARWDVRNPPPAEWISKTPTDWATWVRDHRSQPLGFALGETVWGHRATWYC